MSKGKKGSAARVRASLGNDPTLVENLFNVESVGWVLYLLGLAMIPAAYFFNTIVTEYYWSKTLWAMLLMPSSFILAVWSGSKRGHLIWRKSHVALPYLIFFLVCLLSLTWAANVWKGLERGLQISGGFFAFWGGMHYLNSRKRILQTIYLSIFVAFGITLYGLMQYAEIFYLPKDQYGNADPSTTIGLTNFVVEYLCVMMAMIPMLIFVEKRLWMRSLLMIMGSSIYFYFLIADNRAGYLALITQVGFLLVVGSYIVVKKTELIKINKKQYLTVISAVLIATGVVLVATPLGHKVVDRMSSITDFTGDASIRFRIETWKQSIQNMIPDNLIAGVGLANIEVEFPRYYTDFLEGMTLRHNTRVVRAHNDYVQIMVDLGLLGFIPFLWFLWGLFRTGKDLLEYLTARENFLIFMGLGAGLSGFLVNAIFAFPFQVPASGTYFFLFVVLFDRFRSVVCREHNVPDQDREIPLNGAAALVPSAVMAITLGGQIYGLTYSYHALIAEVRNKEARVFKRFDRWQETLGLMNEAVNHNPNMEGYWYDRAVAFMHFKQYDKALEDLLVTATLVPNYGMGRKQIGVLAAQVGKTELAISEFQAALAIFKSQRSELLKLMSDTAIRQGKPQLFIPIVEDAFAQGFTDVEYYRMYANALAASDRFDDAVKAYETVASRSGMPDDMLANYATALMRTGALEKAEGIFERSLRARGSNAHTLYYYGVLQAIKGNNLNAIETLQRSISIDPRFRKRAAQDKELRSYPDVLSGVLRLE